MSTISERLSALRQCMTQHQIDAWFVPSTDPHGSEYVADHWQGRRWLSGFDGSAGTLVILKDQAGLWTDGRYFLQAETQLQGSGIQLFKAGLADTPSWEKWLSDVLPERACIGFDGEVVSTQQSEKFIDAGFQCMSGTDLLDTIWQDRPPRPSQPAFLLDDAFAGQNSHEKQTALRQRMREEKCDYQLLTSLDDIAWLFNIRGSDIAHCPVTLANALVSQTGCWLFLDAEKRSAELEAALQQHDVTLAEYAECAAHLRTLDNTTLRFDSTIVNTTLSSSIPDSVTKQQGAQLTSLLKATKNPTEVDNVTRCLARDGIAIAKFGYWLDQTISNNAETELSAEAQLTTFREALEHYQTSSFRTIAGYGPHGAIIHYAADEISNSLLENHGLFLVDSGGQYLDGTTDITRTFPLGPLTEEEKRDYTLVLKGFIAMSRAVFKKGTRGAQLDILARAPMMAEGLDYNHGTGHGVGYFLNVHEGPQSLSPRWVDQPLLPGMLITNEPGLYRAGKHGIRIENILLVKEDKTTEFGDFYRFESLTIAPISTRPIVRELLSDDEAAFLNKYHQRVFDTLSPHLSEAESAWLAQETHAI